MADTEGLFGNFSDSEEEGGSNGEFIMKLDEEIKNAAKDYADISREANATVNTLTEEERQATESAANATVTKLAGDADKTAESTSKFNFSGIDGTSKAADANDPGHSNSNTASAHSSPRDGKGFKKWAHNIHKRATDFANKHSEVERQRKSQQDSDRREKKKDIISKLRQNSPPEPNNHDTVASSSEASTSPRADVKITRVPGGLAGDMTRKGRKVAVKGPKKIDLTI